MAFIIDTNVPVNAGKTLHETDLDALCASKCLKFIQDVMNNDQVIILLDSNNDILHEYSNNINIHGAPTVATQFMRWVYRNLTLVDGSRIEQIYLDKRERNCYDEFPDDPKLVGFDPSDRKFVALAIKHGRNPMIIQGSDSLWWRYRDILRANGISIRFLCKEYMVEKSR